MDLGEGMVAVIRGLPDATLTVSLLDGNTQYTLVPNASMGSGTGTAQNPSEAPYVQVSRKPVPTQGATTGGRQESKVNGAHCQTSTQAVDGRYASVYKMAHCNVQPTSPPVQVAEFPPQRAELLPGQGNFEVGGSGSGETSFSPTRTNGSFRGGMNWPERGNIIHPLELQPNRLSDTLSNPGAVFSPRPSREPDAFAKSLRKYPALSPERSSEVVERLINYTHKNAKTCRCTASPTRSEYNSSSQMLNRRNGIEVPLRNQGVYQVDVNVRHNVQDESPTRDTGRRYDNESFESKKSLFGRNCDVRYLLDTNNTVNDTTMNVSSYPYTQPVCGTINENNDYQPLEAKIPLLLSNTNSVHAETQVQISMISREVATGPREHPSTRNVAVPLSPTSSHSAKLQAKHLRNKCSSKSIQTLEPIDYKLSIKKSVQTCLSSIDIPRSTRKKHKSGRKTQSQEELRIRDDIKEGLLQLVKDLDHPDRDTNNVLLKKIKKINQNDRNDDVKIKFGKCIMDQLCSQINLKTLSRELSNELISKINKHNVLFSCYNSTNVFRAESDHFKSNSLENSVDQIIKDWLDDIPLKPVDYLGRHVDTERVLQSVTNKIKSLLTNNGQNYSFRSLKPAILDIIENIPVEVEVRNKMYYLKRIVHDLVQKIEHAYSTIKTDRKKPKRMADVDKGLRNNSRKSSFVCRYVQPTEDELIRFVQEELNAFAAKFNLKICTCTAKEIELELIDILIDSIEAIRYGNEDRVKKEILQLVSDLIQISQQQAIYFANNLIHNLKDMFKETHTGIKSQTFIVLQNSSQNASMQTQNNTNDISIERITDQDIQNNLDLYTQEIVQEINEWMAKIQALSEVDAGFKQVVTHDLAGDIVDRHKYLELNPNSKGSEADELEHLKYQIFKWVNKLVGEDNLETVQQAPKLMQRIQNIPVPMLTRPVHSNDYPFCCQKSFQKIPGTSQSRNLNNTESNSKFIENVTTPKKSAYTGTDLPQRLNTRPRSSSMSRIETKKEESWKRRFSIPADFPLNTKTGTASQTPIAHNYLAKKNASTESPNPGRVQSSSKPSCCYLDPNPNINPTIEELNAKYDEFVKNWVQQIPISLPGPHDQDLIEKLRLGLYNGVWKAIIKIKMNPAVLSNPFYYQDLLDDEIEDLLNCLPPTPELESKKKALKSKLIEETTDMTQQLLNTPSTYKQQLLDNFSMYIPKSGHGVADQDPHKILEDVHKQILVEDFILFTLYNDEDKVKATFYKKRLNNHIQEFIEALKKTHGKELKDIDFKTYKDEVFASLYKVPVPTDDTIRAEGDEILLGFEIAQWFSDLPLHDTDNYYENLSRRRYIDTLTKKIHYLEKEKGFFNCEEELREEITKFIAKLPLREGAVANIAFMVEELVNRLKNRPKDIIAGSGVTRKSVTFVEPDDYNEFSRNMQLCSSFSDEPNAHRAQINQKSFMIVGGERVNDASFPSDPYVVRRRLDFNVTPELMSLIDDGHRRSTFSGIIPINSYSPMHNEAGNSPYRANHDNHQLPARQTFQDPNGQSQIIQVPSFIQPMTTPVPLGGPTVSCQQSLRQPAAESVQRQNNLRQDQNPHTPRQPEAYTSWAYPGTTVPDQQQSAGPCGFPGPRSDPGRNIYDTGHVPTANTLRPESSNKDYEAAGPSAPQPDMRQFTQKSFQHDFSGPPQGSSTFRQNVPPPHQSRAKKRIRETDRVKLDAARRKLNMDSDDDSIREEEICRCMERVWRTCRKKKPYICDDFGMGYPPCFAMRYPFPYYF